jgi:hypothetical protein
MWGRKTPVELSLRNKADVAVDPRVEVQSKTGARLETINAGSLEPNATSPVKLTVKNGNAIQVMAALPTSVDIYRSALLTITGDEKPTRRNFDLVVQGRTVDDSQALQKLSKSFKALGDDIGAAPLTLQNALATRIGALIVAIPAVANREAKILHVVEPNVLGVKVLQLEDVQFPNTNETETVTISGSSAIKATANVAVASFGFSWESSKVYQMKWVLRGFGQVNKIEDPTKSYIAQFNALAPERKAAIRGLLDANTDAKIYYVNRMYVIERAELFVKEGQKVVGSGQLSASSVVTASGAYSFENVAEQNKGYGPVVLNYWGDEFLWAEATAESFTFTNPAFKNFINFDDLAAKGMIDLLVPTGGVVSLALKSDFDV